MDPHQFSFALLAVFCGGLLQGAVAFGFGLLIVPLLMIIGLPVPMVLTVSLICTAFQALSGVHRLRHAVPWRVVGVSFLVRAMTLLAGIWVLTHLADCPMDSIKFWVGAVVLLLAIVQSIWQPRPRPRLHPVWDGLAFASSGFTGGLCAMGGPPLVLWVMAHDWPTDRTRAFLFAAFMSTVPLQIGVLYWTFGHDVLRGLGWGLLLSPAVLAGSWVGLRVGERFSKALLRRLAFVVLSAIALNSMYPKLIGWLRG